MTRPFLLAILLLANYVAKVLNGLRRYTVLSRPKYAKIILMKALYRRYRPKTLSEVVGQEQITSVLEKSIQNGKIAHA